MNIVQLTVGDYKVTKAAPRNVISVFIDKYSSQNIAFENASNYALIVASLDTSYSAVSIPVPIMPEGVFYGDASSYISNSFDAHSGIPYYDHYSSPPTILKWKREPFADNLKAGSTYNHYFRVRTEVPDRVTVLVGEHPDTVFLAKGV